MANEPVILQCRALSKAYGPKPALKNFTADFAAAPASTCWTSRWAGGPGRAGLYP